MLLQSIVAELDRELDHLQALRSIVAGLSRTPKAVAQLMASPVTHGARDIAEAVTSGGERSKPPRKRADVGKTRGMRNPRREATHESRAFAAAIPSGPVVFNPARLAEEKTRREQGKEAPVIAGADQPLEGLDTLARSMAAQWGTASVQQV